MSTIFKQIAAGVAAAIFGLAALVAADAAGNESFRPDSFVRLGGGPAVIVSNDGANSTAARLNRGVVTIVPVTSNVKRIYPFLTGI